MGDRIRALGATFLLLAVLGGYAPVGQARAMSARSTAFEELLHTLDASVSECVQQYNVLQGRYIQYKKAGMLTFSQEDVASSHDACLTPVGDMPAVLRPYPAVARILADWNEVNDHFNQAIDDISAVTFDGMPPPPAERNMVWHVHAANELALRADALTGRLAHGWGLQ